MDLVDGDVNVDIVGIVMNDAYTLVLGEAESTTELTLAIKKHFRLRVFSVLEREKEVIGFVVLRALVLSLNSQSFERSDHRIIRVAVRNRRASDALLCVLWIEQVANKASVTAAAARVSIRFFRDHLARVDLDARCASSSIISASAGRGSIHDAVHHRLQLLLIFAELLQQREYNGTNIPLIREDSELRVVSQPQLQ